MIRYLNGARIVRHERIMDAFSFQRRSLFAIEWVFWRDTGFPITVSIDEYEYALKMESPVGEKIIEARLLDSVLRFLYGSPIGQARGRLARIHASYKGRMRFVEGGVVVEYER